MPKLILVGVQQDDGSIAHLRVYESETWATKYGKAAGDAARYATVEVDFTSTLPAKADKPE